MSGIRTVLHIGADKTGSTAIQRAMADHRAKLADLGVWYPDLDGRPDHRSILATPSTPLPAGSVEGVDHVVLSAEGLWSADRPTIDQLLVALPRPITIVGFVRDPVDHAEAAFGQRLRLSRSEPELAAVLALRAVPAPVNPIVGRARRRLHQLERWVEAVQEVRAANRAGQDDAAEPAVELTVRPYRAGDDVVVELCRAAGLDHLVPVLADRPDPRPNPTPGLDAIHASVLVRRRAGAEAQARFLDAVAARPQHQTPSPPLLPAALRDRIDQVTGPVVARLRPWITGPDPIFETRSTVPAAGSPPARPGRVRLDRARARALVAEFDVATRPEAPEPSG